MYRLPITQRRLIECSLVIFPFTMHESCKAFSRFIKRSTETHSRLFKQARWGAEASEYGMGGGDRRHHVYTRELVEHSFWWGGMPYPASPLTNKPAGGTNPNHEPCEDGSLHTAKQPDMWQCVAPRVFPVQNKPWRFPTQFLLHQ